MLFSLSLPSELHSLFHNGLLLISLRLPSRKNISRTSYKITKLSWYQNLQTSNTSYGSPRNIMFVLNHHNHYNLSYRSIYTYLWLPVSRQRCLGMGGGSDHEDSLSGKQARHVHATREFLFQFSHIVCHIYSEKCRLEVK